jgi:hypothetical protein
MTDTLPRRRNHVVRHTDPFGVANRRAYGPVNLIAEDRMTREQRNTARLIYRNARRSGGLFIARCDVFGYTLMLHRYWWAA